MKFNIKILSPALLLGLLFLLAECSNLYAQYPIVFVSRNMEQGGSVYYPQAGLLPGMGPYSRFKVVGGRLLVREANGTIRVLVDSTMNFTGTTLIDVADPSVHWSAAKIVFSGITHRDSSWRIYEIRSDGTGFKQITSTNRNISLAQFGPIAHKFVRYDDIDPCYLPDGKICFASSRFPSLSQMGAITTNLFIIDTLSQGLHRITTERNGAEEPSIDPVTGKIVFTRWWLNIDMPSIVTANGLTRDSALAVSKDVANIWQAAIIRPDGDALALYSGTANSRIGLHNYKPFVMNNGTLLGVFVPHTPMMFTTGSSGIRWYAEGVDNPHHIVGVNPNTMQLHIPAPPSYGTMQAPYATDPIELPNGKILFSYAVNVESQDYSFQTINLDGSGIQLFYDIPGKLELNPEVLLPRTVPPILQSGIFELASELPPTLDPQTWFQDDGFRFDCVNMFTNGDVDKPMQDAPPITKFARIQFFMNFQRMDSTGRDTAILFTEQPVFHTGQIAFDQAPANVSMFEQVLDAEGKVLRGSTGQVAHVTGMNYGPTGTGTKCVGCHAGHTEITVPSTISEASFFNVSTSAVVTQSSFKFINDSIQYPGARVVDRKARNDSMRVNWIANGTTNQYVNLKWDVPVDVRKVILYNIRTNGATNTNIQVTDCEIILYYKSSEVARIPSTGAISSDGSGFDISSLPKTDELRVIVKSYTGTVNGENLPGLAEVETNARISYYDVFGITQISVLADKFSLNQNYPNPFNPETKIKYSIPFVNNSMYNVRLTVYDVTGRQVALLVNQPQRAGVYEVDFKANNIASGIYFYKLNVDDKYSEVKKMIFVK